MKAHCIRSWAPRYAESSHNPQTGIHIVLGGGADTAPAGGQSVRTFYTLSIHQCSFDFFLHKTNGLLPVCLSRHEDCVLSTGALGQSAIDQSYTDIRTADGGISEMSQTLPMPLAGAVVLAALGLAGTTNAAPLTFFGEDVQESDVPLSQVTRPEEIPNSETAESNFLANLEGVGTEDFDGFATGTSAPLSLTFPGAEGGEDLEATLEGSGSISSTSGDATNNGRWSVSGEEGNYWSTTVQPGAEENFSVDFGQEISAFGFYGTDIGDFGGQLILDFNRADGDPLNRVVPHTIGEGGSTAGSVFFYGLIATEETDAFTSVDFELAGSETLDVFGFDLMTVGEIEQVTPREPVPEPRTTLLIGSGLALLAGVILLPRRRTDIAT